MYEGHKNLGILDSIRGVPLVGPPPRYNPMGSLGTAVFLIICALMWNLLTDDEKKNTIRTITPKPVQMPAPTHWVAHGNKAYQVQSYAPLNGPAGGYPGQNYAGTPYPAQPYYNGNRGGY